MNLRPNLREGSRRLAISLGSKAYCAAGSYRRALEIGGIHIVLLHNTPPPALSRLEAFLVSNHQRLVGYDQAVKLLKSGNEPDRLAIAFSFDDGFSSNLDAARLLRAWDVSACFFVSTGVVGTGQQKVDQFFGSKQEEGVMGWGELSELAELGHAVGSHSHQHRRLSDLSQTQWEDQLALSFEILTQRFGAVNHFAWPFGSLSSAPAKDVVRFCEKRGINVASGVRGRNVGLRFAEEGYLRRDAIRPHNMPEETRFFFSRSRSEASNPIPSKVSGPT